MTDHYVKKSLAVTLKRTLDELPYNANGKIAVNAHFLISLQQAIGLYTSSREEALDLLYREKELVRADSGELEAEYEEVAASCGYFSFSLLDFANETKSYLELLDDLKLEVEERPGGRTWSWLHFWNNFHNSRAKSKDDDPGKSPPATPASSSFVLLLLMLLRAGQPDRCKRGDRDPQRYTQPGRA